MTTFSDSDLQNGFRLVYCLHPDRAVAPCVLLDGCEQALLVQNNQRRRHGYRLHTPDEGCLQFGIYLASEDWEKDQESESPEKEPKYKPTRNDRRARYVKALVKESMDRRPVYGGVGVATLLFQYEPHHVSQLSEDIFKYDNIRRSKGRMVELLKGRFIEFSGCNGELPFEKPSEHQRALIEASLSLFSPRAACPTSAALLETYFQASSTKSDWERLHVLFGRFPQLVNEYNSMFSKGNKMRLEDPEKMLGCPKFGDDSDDPPDDDEPEPPDRFNPPPLTREEISMIRHSLEKNKRRREKYKQQTLRVVVDGKEIATLTPSVSKSAVIPATSSRIEIFGQDEYGKLLLAVFPLTSLEDDNRFDQQVSINEHHKIDLSLLLSEDSSKYSVWLRYSEVLKPSTRSAAYSPPSSRIRILFLSAAPQLHFKEQLRRDIALLNEELTRKSVIVKFFEENASSLYEILTRVKHPNVASVFNTGTLDGRSYAVMESVSGVNLRTRIGPRGMNLSEIFSVTTELTDALAALHANSILHRDIKPDNIMLQDRNGEMHVKLCDFGLVNDLERAYTAPELLRGTPVSAQSDIYSLGVTLYEMCTGWTPFNLNWSADQFVSKYAELKSDPWDQRPDLPRAMREVIGRALMADPKERYNSAQDMGKAIATAFNETKLPTPRYRWLDRKDRERRSSEASRILSYPVRSQLSLSALLREVVNENSPFEELLSHGKVRARLLRICATAPRKEPWLSSDDFYQDVCLKLLEWTKRAEKRHWQETKDRWQGENAFFEWLRTFASNVYRNRKRRLETRALKIVKTIEEITPAEQKYYPARTFEEEEILHQFRGFCRTLPAGYQEAIRLWAAGFSYREIAEKLKNNGIACSHATVGEWVRTAIKNFQKRREKDIAGSKRRS